MPMDSDRASREIVIMLARKYAVRGLFLKEILPRVREILSRDLRAEERNRLLDLVEEAFLRESRLRPQLTNSSDPIDDDTPTDLSSMPIGGSGKNRVAMHLDPFDEL